MRITHGKTNHPLYRTWDTMKSRCKEKASGHYRRFYHKRGISICKEWESFATFYEWAKDKWVKGLEIDRKDTLQGYGPENCRFVTHKKNMENSRHSRFWVVYGKQFQASSDAAKFFGCSKTHIYRLCYGIIKDGKTYYPEPFCYSLRKYNND